MKLNWFSPLPPAKTGIAEYTVRVLSALQHYAEITLWTDQSSCSLELEQYANIRHYDLANLLWADLNQADLNIYHIGNNPSFHNNIWQISCQCPGLVVLHDFKLHEFFYAIYHGQWDGRARYIAQMFRYYGSKGTEDAEKCWFGKLPIEFMIENYPLTSLALENALGVITHTKEVFNILKQEKSWPVVYAPLPYVGTQLRRKSRSQPPPYKLIVFGYSITPNRRLDKFLEALSELPEKNYFQVNIYGEVWDVDYIHSLIHKLGLADLVTLHGFVEEVELNSALDSAHLAINMRYPTMGEASLSQIQIWSHALPSLVTRVGWYAELPEDAVAFVRLNREIEDIQQQLRKMLTNFDEFVQMGKNGQRMLEESHTPEVYAQAIADFASKARSYRRRLVAHKLVEVVGEQVSTWSRSELTDLEIRRVAESIHFLCM